MLGNDHPTIARGAVYAGIQLAGNSWKEGTNLTWDFVGPNNNAMFVFSFVDLGPMVLGQATGWIDNAFHIRFNSEANWTSERIQGVALHEIGHAIGLHHTWHPSASMYPSSNHFGTGVPTRALHPEDVVPANLMYGEWESIPGTAKDIAVAPNGTVWKITEAKVSQWVESTRTWQDIPGNIGGGTAIDVDSSNKPWIVSLAAVYSLNTNNTWTKQDEGICAGDIGAGPAGTIYVAHCTVPGLYRWKGNVLGVDWEKLPNVPADRVDVDALGRPWIVTGPLAGSPIPIARVQRLINGVWETLPGANTKDISVGGAAAIVGAPASVFPWRTSGGRVHAFSEQTQVGDVGGSSSIQGSFEWNLSEGLPAPQVADRVSTGPNGAAWVVTTTGAIYRRSRY